MKDWTGNNKSVFTTLGASNHVSEERQEHDYYATDPIAADILMDNYVLHPEIWECACGEGHLSKRLTEKGYSVKSTDLIERGFGIGGIDFLKQKEQWNGDIVTNPPFKFASQFIEHALSLIEDGRAVAMFLKLQFLETSGRKELFTKYPPRYLMVSSSRIPCAKNGDFEGLKKSGGSAVAFAWYIWVKGYTGKPEIIWVN